MEDLEYFNHELQADLTREALESGTTTKEAFFEQMVKRLEITGEIETSERAPFEGLTNNRTLRIDGSGGHPRDSDGVLSLILCDLREEAELVTINQSDTKRLFSQLLNFLVFARRAEFRDSLERGSPSFGLADTITTAWAAITKIKLILITNALYTARTDAVKAGLIDKVPVTYNVWDLSRFHRYESSGQAREDLVINFRDDFGGAIPALAASQMTDQFESYLMVIPGAQLARIYDEWGARLLESNVRSFLQARGKVNQAIRDTLRNEPSMFFSYNNGLSATADQVDTHQSKDGLSIASVRNLQIVNGGQTTASIHAARRLSPESMAKVHVQMKLTVVPVERSEEIVPRISETANSQNKVSAADFFSNHPFHIRVEEFSRRLLAPAAEDKNRETQWFYERTRGQYLVERSKCSDAERRKFDAQFPKAQLFAKTDLAKVEFSFRGRPDVVSKGAQKNFSEFAKDIGEMWARGNSLVDETWYRRLIAKLIIFRHLESVIPKQGWYPGGYRANIVTYAISKFASDVSARGQEIDLDAIWKKQLISNELELGLLDAAKVATRVLTQPILGINNITEWAKKQACWENLRSRKVEYSQTVATVLIEPEAALEVIKDGRRDAAIVSGIEAQTKVIAEGADFWARLRSWGAANQTLPPKEDGILKACTAIPLRLPSEKQCIAALHILAKAKIEGYQDSEDGTRVKIGAWNRQH